ncbi:MAG: hypothetical protein ABIU10_08075 [Sphingomicrobium sp.]
MKALLCLAAGAVTLASSATAQRIPVAEKPPKFEPSGPKVGTKNTRRVVQDFARCLARRSMSGVALYLDRNMASLTPTLGRHAPECLGDAFEDGDGAMLKGQSDTYRVAMAEAYVVRKYREAGLGDLATVSPLVHPGETGPHGAHALGTLSECIIRRSPAESWALLRTDAATPSEATAFAALSPAMQACVTRGTTVKMQAFFMRGAIAETYYLLSLAPRSAVAGAAQ